MTFAYNIKSIPTTYAGVNFRSRLEARWAAFFDMAGWKWDYEPFDLNGWAPDFMLKGKVKALVEVKPINFSQDEGGAMFQAMASAEKAFNTATTICPSRKPVEEMTQDELDADYASSAEKPQYEILIVGNGPFTHGSWNRWGLGVMPLEGSTRGQDHADLFFGETSLLDYAARYGDYKYRVGGQHRGDHHLVTIDDDTPERLWREAGNAVQWIPKANNFRRRRAA